MPEPKVKESKVKFLARCIPALVADGRSLKQAAAICSALYEQPPEEKK
jgi:hypothetical protein